MKHNKSIFNQLIGAVVALSLSFLIKQSLGLASITSVTIACIVLLSIISIQSIIEYQSRKSNLEVLSQKLDDLKSETKKIIEGFRQETTDIVSSSILRTYLTQNNNHKTSQYSNVLNFSEVIEIEKGSNEIWIFAKNLEYEMTDNELTKLVLDNLKRGCTYHYIVPDTSKIRQRVKALLLKFKKAEIPEKNIQFRIKEQDLLMSFFGITIYNPTLSNNIENNKDSIVVFFPDSKHLRDKEDRMFITVFDKATIPVQEDFNTIWEMSKIIQLNSEDNIHIENS